MLKQCLLVLLAASLISIAAPFAAAQSSTSNDSPSNNQPSAQGNGGWHHGPPDPAQRTHELTRKLNLASDQQAKVQDILQSNTPRWRACTRTRLFPSRIAAPK